MNLKNNTKLVTLYVGDHSISDGFNKLTSLDISHCTKLRQLACQASGLKVLDVSNCPKLKNLVQKKERCADIIINYWREGETYLTVDEGLPVIAGSMISATANNGKYLISGNAATFMGLLWDDSVESVTIPPTMKVLGKTYKITSVASDACRNLRELSSVTIGKYVKTIGKNAFRNCTALTEIKAGTAIVSVGDFAFCGCKALKTFPAPGKLQAIGANAFRSCVKLARFTLGSAVKSIGANAFYGCKALKAITVKTTKLTTNNVGAGAFKGIYRKAAFKCPAAKLKAYKTLFVKKGAPKTCTFEK